MTLIACSFLFLSGQAASHIPEFPSFFLTNTYTLNLRRFPVEGKEVRREINELFWFRFDFFGGGLTCHTYFHFSLCSVFNTYGHFHCNPWGEQVIRESVLENSSKAVPLSLSFCHRHCLSVCKWSDEDWNKECLSQATSLLFSNFSHSLALFLSFLSALFYSVFLFFYTEYWIDVVFVVKMYREKKSVCNYGFPGSTV